MCSRIGCAHFAVLVSIKGRKFAWLATILLTLHSPVPFAGRYPFLSHWDDFLHCHYPKARKVHAEIFFGWTRELSHLSPTMRRAWQRLIRNWLLFHARDHTGTFIPDLLTFPKPIPAQLPRLVSEAEMARILQAAWQLSPSRTNPLRAETIAVGLLLLFCCGLRRGELLRLKLGDLDRNQGLLSIVETKFHTWVTSVS
jgi:integrase/recombinase XerD